MMPTYTFTQEEVNEANREWGCNCGPAALAFALQAKIGVGRYAIPHFDERRYTSPRMMEAALEELGRPFTKVWNPSQNREHEKFLEIMFAGPMSLVRIQWCGPWTAMKRPSLWASKYTHWIACWTERGVRLVFDINGGIRSIAEWDREIRPQLTACYERADGAWYPANVWRLVS